MGLERVVKIMDWRRNVDLDWIDKNDNYICLHSEIIFNNTPTGHWLSHLLIEKMQRDGYKIGMNAFPIIDNRKQFEFWASPFDTYTSDPGGKEFSASADNLPAAILSLFCKVNKIEGE